MASTFWGMDIATSALYASQLGISVTAHNISNAATKGYCRQEAIRKAANPISIGSTAGMIGTGVEITGIRQIRDLYYDNRYRANSSKLGEYNIRNTYMLEIEQSFSEVSTSGVNAELDDYFNSLVELQKDTTNPTKRQQVMHAASALTDYLNSLSKSLSSVQEDANFEIKTKADEINSLAQQIVAYNNQINAVEVNGSQANDLRDQRNNLIDRLSEIAPVEVRDLDLGNGVTSFNVDLAGYQLVSDNQYNSLVVVASKAKTNQSDSSGLYELHWNKADGAELKMNSADMTGELKGLFDIRDGNNRDTFSGTITNTEIGGNSITISSGVYGNKANINKLTLPSSGKITIDNAEYDYKSFSVNEKEDGTLEYTFEIDGELTRDLNGSSVQVGDKVNYKGVPYYQQQLNEFVRTLTSSINKIHTTGVDTEGNDVGDFFSTNSSGNSLANLNSEGKIEFSSADKDSYYNMTAGNIIVNKEIQADVNKIATLTKDEFDNGKEQSSILDSIIGLKTDSSMFKQGTTSQFLQSVLGDVSVDAKNAKSLYKAQSDVVATITNQKASISGVDTNEEGTNLVKYQNAYNIAAKLISVMNEMYNKLINEMGV